MEKVREKGEEVVERQSKGEGRRLVGRERGEGERT